MRSDISRAVGPEVSSAGAAKKTPEGRRKGHTAIINNQGLASI